MIVSYVRVSVDILTAAEDRLPTFTRDRDQSNLVISSLDVREALIVRDVDLDIDRANRDKRRVIFDLAAVIIINKGINKIV